MGSVAGFDEAVGFLRIRRFDFVVGKDVPCPEGSDEFVDEVAALVFLERAKHRFAFGFRAADPDGFGEEIVWNIDRCFHGGKIAREWILFKWKIGFFFV